MTAPTPNAELAYRVLDQVDADPASWDQSKWFYRPLGASFGTAACFAGWTSLLSGDEPRWVHGYQMQTYAVVASGKTRYIEARAAELLGIDENQADALFYGGNTREDLG